MEKSTKFTAIVNKNNAIVIPKTARLKTDIRPGSMLDVTVEVVARNEAERAAMLACAEDLHGIDEGHLIEARRQLSEERPEAFQ